MTKKSSKQPGDTPKKQPRTGRSRSFWSRNKDVLRAGLIFVVCFGVLMAAIQTHPEVRIFIDNTTAKLTALALTLLGASGEAKGTLVSNNVLTIEVIHECTAVAPVLIFLAAVIAYPCRWHQRLLGVLLGVPAILLINIVRLVSLCYVGRWRPSMLDTAHLVVWQALMIFVTVLVWIVWAAALARSDETDPA